MISIELSTHIHFEQSSDGFALFVASDSLNPQIEEAAQRFFPPLQAELERRAFKGAAGSVAVVTGLHNGKPITLILLGTGKAAEPLQHLETYRRALGTLVRTAERHKLGSVVLEMPPTHEFACSTTELAQYTASTLFIAHFNFDVFLTDPAAKMPDLKITLAVPPEEQAAAGKGLEQGIIIGNAVNNARLWCDMPPAEMTPSILAGKAEEIAQRNNLPITVFNGAQLHKMGMNGITGVGRGSVEDPRMVIIEYRTEHPAAPTIAIVGKGVTFDSGGLSLKPSRAMETMKDDMAAAAVVLSAIDVLAQLKAPVNIIACAPMVENMPSGSAHKPGDIIRFYNGKTAEVKDTDAEGRLILADALSYTIEKYHPTLIVSLATLTGACAHALGPFYAGMFSRENGPVKQFDRAAAVTGDRVWRLPLDDDYKPAIKSHLADMANIGTATYLAGATTAALFLENFVDDNTPWVHLDIAGVAFNVPDISYYRPGATGFGVRLLTYMLMHWPQQTL